MRIYVCDRCNAKLLSPPNDVSVPDNSWISKRRITAELCDDCTEKLTALVASFLKGKEKKQ